MVRASEDFPHFLRRVTVTVRLPLGRPDGVSSRVLDYWQRDWGNPGICRVFCLEPTAPCRPQGHLPLLVHCALNVTPHCVLPEAPEHACTPRS
jgi:hypothetical protein